MKKDFYLVSYVDRIGRVIYDVLEVEKVVNLRSELVKVCRDVFIHRSSNKRETLVAYREGHPMPCSYTLAEVRDREERDRLLKTA